MPDPRSRSLRSALCPRLAAAALVLACGTPPVPYSEPPPTPVLPEALAPGSAWSHLEALAALGPRVSGTEGAAKARAYLARQLTALGLRVEDDLPAPAAAGAATEAEAQAPAESATDPAASETQPPQGPGPEPRNLLGVLPGASEDLILLVAPYDSAPPQSAGSVGANDGASGAALLLAMARALAEAPLPYTTWFLFLDGEAAGADGSGGLRGSSAAAQRLAAAGLVGRVRLLLALNRVCDPDLRVARDLLSHRPYREEFWRSAEKLGYRELFEQARFEQPRGSHWPFQRLGVRSVALMDTSSGGGDPPAEPPAGTPEDDLAHCSLQSLDSVGSVALDGLESIARRLVKIDRFAAAPDLALTRPAHGEGLPVAPAGDPWAPSDAQAPAPPVGTEAPAPAAVPEPAGAGEEASPPATGAGDP